MTCGDKTRVRVNLWSIMCIWVLLTIVAAQDPVRRGEFADGTILGTLIGGPERSPVPGAAVTITNSRTGLQRSVITDDRGRFHVRNLPAGDYVVRAELSGFQVVEERVDLQPGATVDLGPVPLGEADELDPVSTSDHEIEVIEKVLRDELEAQRWLNQNSARELLAVIPNGDAQSVFVFEVGSSTDYTVMLVAESLQPEDLRERIELQPNKLFVGVHRLTERSYILIFKD